MKMIQLRNVPEEMHRVLKSRAALEGKSLSDYLIEELALVAQKPTAAELRERIRSQPCTTLKESTAAAVRAERNAR